MEKYDSGMIQGSLWGDKVVRASNTTTLTDLDAIYLLQIVLYQTMTKIYGLIRRTKLRMG